MNCLFCGNYFLFYQELVGRQNIGHIETPDVFHHLCSMSIVRGLLGFFKIRIICKKKDIYEDFILHIESNLVLKKLNKLVFSGFEI